MSEPASLFDRLLDDVIDASRLGCSVLVHAAVQGHVEVLTSILQRISSNQHRTPCHEEPGLTKELEAAFVGAAEQGHSTCLAAMLESGCSGDAGTTKQAEGGNTALLLGVDSEGDTALTAAAGNGHAECVQQLLQHNPEAQVAAADSCGWNALMMAALNGHVECVQQLLQHNPAAQVAATNNKGWNALRAAALNGHAECVQQLLQHNPVAQVAVADNNAWTALMTAAWNGHVECVQQLLQHDPVAQVAAATTDQSTALLLATMNDRPDCVALLLPHSPPQVSAAVHTAARHGFPLCLDLLLTVECQQQELDLAWLSALQQWNVTDARTSPHTQCLERLMAKGAAMPIQPTAADHAKNRLFLQALASRALVPDRTNAAVVELAQSVRSRKRKSVHER